MRGLADRGITVKVVTGDNEPVAARVCADVGLDAGRVVSGREIDRLDDPALRELAARTTVFAKVNPAQKARVVRALRADGHTVGFLGDGINDAAALRDADVGISVDTAVDIARESADIILLEKGLVYDLAQLATPWDRMDEEYLRRPRTWDARGIGRFIVTLGPVSSVFDIAMFQIMWHVFGANDEAAQSLFQSGWVVEGLLSQTLVVHMIRTRKIPFIQSRASWPVMAATVLAVLTGLFLPFSPLAGPLGMVPLPPGYFPWLIAVLLAYCALTQAVKTWYVRRFGSWL
ncbi:HAD-IC family P-type ATPase [Streptomyces sp. NPDC051578]|uniref:HAD-IC family P-type ATPase n=1 Tax=Streptomyces sp. NPDC051578 TaxID=3365662 RepID=UPI0037873564